MYTGLITGRRGRYRFELDTGVYTVYFLGLDKICMGCIELYGVLFYREYRIQSR